MSQNEKTKEMSNFLHLKAVINKFTKNCKILNNWLSNE